MSSNLTKLSKSSPSLQMLGQSGWDNLSGLSLKWTPYIPHNPTPKQLAFLLLDSLEVFYGGAAGGGKSDALLAAALQYSDVPNYAAILFRKTITDLKLPGALLDLSHQWLDAEPDARWHDDEKTWVFSSKATLSFGYLDGPSDKYRYQSSQFQFIGFDELTQFREEDYRYLFSRLRRLAASDVPLRIRAASNPGGAGHEWVKQRFITEGFEHDRPFISASLNDNPYLDKESYIKSLSNLDVVTRQQLLDGNWDVRPDRVMFKRDWFTTEDVPNHIPGAKICRFWDLAATTVGKKNKNPDYTAGCKMAMMPNGTFYILDIRRVRATPAKVEKLVRQTAEIDGRGCFIFMEQEPGASGVNTVDYYRRKVLPGFIFYPIRSTGSKELRAMPLSSQCEGGNVKLRRGNWINAFLDELEGFPIGEHDDQVDAASGAFGQLSAAPPEVDDVTIYDSMELVEDLFI